VEDAKRERPRYHSGEMSISSERGLVPAAPSRACPRCGSNDLRRSGKRTLFDRLLRLFSLKPYRCRACRARFHRAS
jgi:hypothetical protein